MLLGELDEAECLGVVEGHEDGAPVVPGLFEAGLDLVTAGNELRCGLNEVQRTHWVRKTLGMPWTT